MSGTAASKTAPDRAGLVLVSLILVAAVANLNLAVANVALPDIGEAFDASQTALNLVAVGYSLGLAASVLCLGALGDRYGRKLMLSSDVALGPGVPVAAWAPSDEVLFGARILGGLAAGMAYPTTLALITALWSGPARTRSIALWSAIGGAIAALGPLVSGGLLEHFWWGRSSSSPCRWRRWRSCMASSSSRAMSTRPPTRSTTSAASSPSSSSARSSSRSTSPRSRRGRARARPRLVALAALVGFIIRQRARPTPSTT